MNEKTLKEISEILDKDVDSITKGDSLRIGSFLTDNDFYLFTERFPEDTLTITKKAIDLIEKIKLMENIPLRLLYMVPLPTSVFPMLYRYHDRYYRTIEQQFSKTCGEIRRKVGCRLDTHRFLLKDKNVVKVRIPTVGIAKDISAIKESFVKNSMTPYNPELANYFADRDFVYATTVNLSYPIYIKVFKDGQLSDYPFDSVTFDDMIFIYMQKKMKLSMVACSDIGNNTEVYVDVDDVDKISSLLSLQKQDIWRHSVEIAKSRWNRIDDTKHFDKEEAKDWGDTVYADKKQALLYFTPRFKKTYIGNTNIQQRYIVLTDGDEMFVQKSRSMIESVERFFFSGIDRCLELEKKKEQLVEELPEIDR